MTTAAQQAISTIKTKAESAGFRMSDVCRVAQIDQAQVSRWLSGVTEPLYGSVKRLEQAVDALIAARMKTLSESMDAAVGKA
jgi:transcriptional regulator with XRE-family HTH domain